MTDKEAMTKCYQRLYQCMIEKDAAGLAEILDNAFILTHMTGMRQSKAAFIRAVENGTLNYFSAKHEDVQTACDGTAEKLVRKSLVEAAVFGGGRSAWRLQLILRLKKKGDNWIILEATASTY